MQGQHNVSAEWSLTQFAKALGEAFPTLAFDVVGDVDEVSLRHLTEDSRQVRSGTLFIARPGDAQDGRAFIGDAFARGAAALVTDAATAEFHAGVPAIVSDDLPLATAMIAEVWFGQPSLHVGLIGVTGTNGKSTVAHIVRHLLRHAGQRCGLVGTIETDDGITATASELTTPSAIEISGLLSRMREHGVPHCVMEVSSHALVQQRVAGLSFDVGVFTNISGDHMDYHGTFERYIDAKSMLFQTLTADDDAVINLDDQAAQVMCDAGDGRLLGCSLIASSACANAAVEHSTIHGSDVIFSGPWGEIRCHLPLIGRHNVINALQAVAVGHCCVLDARVLQRGLETCDAPAGRLECVTALDGPTTVLVDYAHTDDALDNALRALQPLVPDGAMLKVLFGCGGDRDPTKRARMARVACLHADEVFVTSDNPRTECPEAIIDDIYEGIELDADVLVRRDVDRCQSIGRAIESLQHGDVLLIAGKGHEDYQIIGTTKRHMDDREIARRALQEGAVG